MENLYNFEKKSNIPPPPLDVPGYSIFAHNCHVDIDINLTKRTKGTVHSCAWRHQYLLMRVDISLRYEVGERVCTGYYNNWFINCTDIYVTINFVRPFFIRFIRLCGACCTELSASGLSLPRYHPPNPLPTHVGHPLFTILVSLISVAHTTPRYFLGPLSRPPNRTVKRNNFP